MRSMRQTAALDSGEGRGRIATTVKGLRSSTPEAQNTSVAKTPGLLRQVLRLSLTRGTIVIVLSVGRVSCR